MEKLLPEICTIQYGFPFDSSKFSDTDGVPLIRIRDVVRGYSQTFTTEEYKKEYLVYEGDLLIGMDGEFNIAKWGNIPALLNQRVCRLIPTSEVDKDYLFYFMPNALKRIEQKTPFVTVKHLSAKELNKVRVPLPPMEEQRKIAAQLDKVSDLIAKRQAQLDKLDLLVKVRFVEMFGDPVMNPFGYPIHQLSEYIEFLTSGSRGWSQYFSDAGEYFITIKNVKNCAISLDDVQHVQPPENAEAVRTKVKEGDLLISITADLGRTGVVTKEIAEHGAYINQHLTCIRLNQDRLIPLYVAYYLESSAGKVQFTSKNQNGVKAGLNFNAINSLKLIVPPMELQAKFIGFVSQIENNKYSIKYSLEKLETMKKALMQKYFG